MASTAQCLHRAKPSLFAFLQPKHEQQHCSTLICTRGLCPAVGPASPRSVPRPAATPALCTAGAAGAHLAWHHQHPSPAVCRHTLLPPCPSKGQTQATETAHYPPATSVGTKKNIIINLTQLRAKAKPDTHTHLAREFTCSRFLIVLVPLITVMPCPLMGMDQGNPGYVHEVVPPLTAITQSLTLSQGNFFVTAPTGAGRSCLLFHFP